MRRMLTFACEGETCVATLHEGTGGEGLLIVSGGQDVRAGAHGWQAMLADALALDGHPVLRFDRRGAGDSGGPRTGFRDSRPDLIAAAGLLRREAPSLTRVVGLGNCDGATALALFGREAGLDGLVLLNPWLVPDEDEMPPPAAIRSRYRSRLFEPRAWWRLITGRIDPGKAMRGLARAATPGAGLLAEEVAGALETGALPAHVILARGDATAIACAAAWRTRAFAAIRTRVPVLQVDTGSHSFGGDGDGERLCAAVRQALAALA